MNPVRPYETGNGVGISKCHREIVLGRSNGVKEAGLTKQERGFLTLLRIWMVLFFLTTILFIIAPDWTLNYLTDIGRGIFGWSEPPIALGAERFWFVLAIALLATLTYICFEAQRDFLRNIDYARPIIIAKFISTLGFLICLMFFGHRFFYLVGALIDGLIFIITWYYYNAAAKSRSR